MRKLWLVVLAVGAIGTAAHMEKAYQADTVLVPASHVQSDACYADGGIDYAIAHPAEPGVVEAKCRDGVWWTTGYSDAYIQPGTLP